MTELISDPYRRALAIYSEDLLELVATRLSKLTRAKRTGETLDYVLKQLSTDKMLAKIIAKLDSPHLLALAILRRSPMVPWRWDHALRILEASGVVSAYTVLQELLELGLVYMRRTSTDDSLVRFDVVTGVSPEGLPLVAIAAPLAELPLELPEPGCPLTPREAHGAWRHADGWEWPMRLAILWQLAWLAPIKRTQQKVLFKRDRDRLVLHPLLASDTLDALVKIHEPGFLAYQLAMNQGWLDPQSDEQSPTAPLRQVWPNNLDNVLLQCGRGLVTAEGWNELGSEAPVGSFGSDVIASRFFALFWLTLIPEHSGATIEEIAQGLERTLPPWNGEGELTGPLRQPKDRSQLCRKWLNGFLLGPAYQAGFIEVAGIDTDETLVRLTHLGRKFLGLQVDLPERMTYPQSLLVQPNHQIIVYRQALSIDLLVQIVLFAEPRSAGAALTFEITSASVYHGLEAGMQPEQIIDLLNQQSGRPIPSGVEESIRTWSQKRERLSIYQDASLFEFERPEDMKEAMERGLVGQPVTDRILLVEGQEGTFKNLRITASRDYRLEPQPCVDCLPNGISLAVDLEKSDLMLESELKRFSDPLPYTDKNGRRLFQVTRDSVERAYDLGLRADFFDQWFKQRTGNEPPESVRLLVRAVAGLRLQAKSVIVLVADSPLVADGLMQHPLTSELFAERLGPSALAVDVETLPKLKAALGELGISLDMLSQAIDLRAGDDTA
jgi:hypothetical protein